MTITVRYMAQLRTAAGTAEEHIEDAPTLSLLLHSLAQRHGSPLARLLFDAQDRPQPTVLVFVNDEQADPDQETALSDGAIVTLLSPIAGGQP